MYDTDNSITESVNYDVFKLFEIYILKMYFTTSFCNAY